MADDLYCANLVIAHHKPDQVVEFKVALKEATLFNSEEDAAELGLKAGLEWVRDNG